MEQRFRLIQGDCLEVMKTFESNTFDSIITDPPYALSEGNSTQRVSERIYNALFKIGFPDLDKLNTQFLESGSFAGVAGDGSALGIKNGAIRKDAGIGVPESAVDLQNDDSVDQEISDGNISPGLGVADGILTDEGQPKNGHFLGDFILKLGDVQALSISGDMPDSCLAEAFYSGFAVPIIAALAPSLPSLDAGFMPIMLGNHDIGLGDNPLSQAFATPSILTLPRTVNTLMLRFDLRGRPVELLATQRTDHLRTIGNFDGAQLVRAFPAASGLSTVAEPYRVRFVIPTADGAYSFYWFHLWTPRDIDVKCIIPRGGFMGKSWDATLPDPQVWREMLRVAKPGAFLLAFGGTRTWHRLASAIEDAGWVLKDTIMYLYGSGFPKSLNISKAIDAHLGAERTEIIGSKLGRPGMAKDGSNQRNGFDHAFGGEKSDAPMNLDITAPATDAAKLWDGWGSALKPAWEPIIVAMKPLEGTFAQNALRWGCAGLNVDGCRVGTKTRTNKKTAEAAQGNGIYGQFGEVETQVHNYGRWPANLTLDQSAADLLDEMSGELHARGNQDTEWQGSTPGQNTYGKYARREISANPGDTGGASRYFTVLPDSEPRFYYTAKASSKERSTGLNGSNHKVQLRSDLTEEQKKWVYQELEKAGVDTSL